MILKVTCSTIKKIYIMRKQNIVMIFGHYNDGNSIVFLVITKYTVAAKSTKTRK